MIFDNHRNKWLIVGGRNYGHATASLQRHGKFVFISHFSGRNVAIDGVKFVELKRHGKETEGKSLARFCEAWLAPRASKVNQILRCDWLLYMELSCLFRITRCPFTFTLGKRRKFP